MLSLGREASGRARHSSRRHRSIMASIVVAALSALTTGVVMNVALRTPFLRGTYISSASDLGVPYVTHGLAAWARRPRIAPGYFACFPRSGGSPVDVPRWITAAVSRASQPERCPSPRTRDGPDVTCDIPPSRAGLAAPTGAGRPTSPRAAIPSKRRTSSCVVRAQACQRRGERVVQPDSRLCVVRHRVHRSCRGADNLSPARIVAGTLRLFSAWSN